MNCQKALGVVIRIHLFYVQPSYSSSLGYFTTTLPATLTLPVSLVPTPLMALMVMLTVPVATCGGVSVSCTCTVGENVPEDVGVPEISPVTVLSVNPGGSVPGGGPGGALVTVHVLEPLPPVLTRTQE